MSATPNINLLKIKGNKFDATTAPTSTDDSSAGYYVGSLWVDVTNDKIYFCVDNTDTSAIWNEAGGGGDSIYTADGTLSGVRSMGLNNNKLTFDIGTVASGTNNTIGLVVDGSNVYYGGGANSSPLLQVEGGLGNVLNVNSGGYLIATSDYSSAIALFEKRGTNLGLSLASNKQTMGVPLIQHKPLLTSGSSQMIQQFVSSTLVDFQMINADGATGDNPNIKHWLRFGDSLNQATFFRTGISGRGFVVGAQFVLGTEDISLQGETAIKGYGTTTGTTLALYDNDTTPSKTWEWLDNGNVNVNQNTDINTSNTFNFVNGSKEVGIASWNVHAYWGVNNGTRRWDMISANSSSIFNANEFGIANGSSVPIRIFNDTSVALGNVNKSNLNNSYAVQTAGDTLIGGDLHATDGSNIIELDFNNYPKVKLGTPTQEWWLIEGDGTGSTFENGDLYFYDSTNSRKVLHFKANGTINIPNLPTSNSGLSADDLWNDNGSIRIGTSTPTGGDSLYTADGSLTGNRIVDLDNNNLTFNATNIGALQDPYIEYMLNGGIEILATGTEGAIKVLDSRIANTNIVFNVGRAVNSNGTWNQQNIKIGKIVDNDYLEITSSSFNFIDGGTVRHKFFGTSAILSGNALIGTEDISLQGETFIQGVGTTTGTTLALYDNDTTPNKTWDFKDNGDVYIGQNTNFEGGDYGFVFNRTTGTNTIALQTGGVNFATFRSGLTEIASSTIHLGSLGGSNGLKIESDRVRYYTSVGSAGVIHDIHADRFALFGQGFSTPSNSYFSIGSFTRIGTEDISLQGDVLMNANINMSNLPTSNSGLSAGDLWNDNGSVRIGTSANNALHTNISNEINSVTEKTDPSNTDKILIEESDGTKKSQSRKNFKRLIVSTNTTTSSLTPSIDDEEAYVLTALSDNLTINAPTGTPYEFQNLWFRITDNGVSRTITKNAIFVDYTGNFPTSTTPSKQLIFAAQWDGTNWNVLAWKIEP